MNLRFDSTLVDLAAAGPSEYYSGHLSDKALLKKLQQVGVIIDKETLGKLGENAMCLTPIFDAIYKIVPEPVATSAESDWITGGVWELWRRWFPDRLICELLQDRLESITSLLHQDKISAAARVLYRTWPAFLKFFDTFGVRSAAKFRTLGAEQADLIDNLSFVIERVSDEGGPRHLLADRISLCEQVLERLAPAGEQDEAMASVRNVLAQSYMTLEQYEKVDELYINCLLEDATQCVGWQDWASCYHGSSHPEHAEKAVQILRDGLSEIDAASEIFSPAIQDNRHALLELLSFYLERQERWSELEDVRHQLEDTAGTTKVSAKPVVTTESPIPKPYLSLKQLKNEEKLWEKIKHVMSAAPVIFPSLKVGQNTPCPCLSGAKFKRCCGRGG